MCVEACAVPVYVEQLPLWWIVPFNKYTSYTCTLNLQCQEFEFPSELTVMKEMD